MTLQYVFCTCPVMQGFSSYTVHTAATKQIRSVMRILLGSGLTSMPWVNINWHIRSQYALVDSVSRKSALLLSHNISVEQQGSHYKFHSLFCRMYHRFLHCRKSSPSVCQTFHHSRHSVVHIGETPVKCSVIAPAIHRLNW